MNEYKIAIVVRQQPVNGLWQVRVEGVTVDSLPTEADAEAMADRFGRFPNDILEEMTDMIRHGADQTYRLATERFVEDREHQLARQYQYIADVANAATRVALLIRGVK